MASERGFTLTEVLLSVAIWGMLIVPFLIYYGGMQKALYLSHGQLNVLHVSRLTMDQVGDDLRRMNPTGIVLAERSPPDCNSVGECGLCFTYTPAGGSSQTISYRWDRIVKKLMIKRGSCPVLPDDPAEQPMPTYGNDAYIQGVRFNYYNATRKAAITPDTSPNFKRIGIEIDYRAQPNGIAYTTVTNVTPRNI